MSEQNQNCKPLGNFSLDSAPSIRPDTSRAQMPTPTQQTQTSTNQR